MNVYGCVTSQSGHLASEAATQHAMQAFPNDVLLPASMLACSQLSMGSHWEVLTPGQGGEQSPSGPIEVPYLCIYNREERAGRLESLPPPKVGFGDMQLCLHAHQKYGLPSEIGPQPGREPYIWYEYLPHRLFAAVD